MGAEARFYNTTMTSTRPARASDGAGGWTEGQIPLITVPAACASRPATTQEKEIAAAEGAIVTDVLYCAGTTDVRRGDLVTVSGRGPDIAKVQHVDDPAHLGRYLMVFVETEQQGG